MARSTISDIITRVRDLIGDPAIEESDEGTSHFSDDQIEAALDRRRSEWTEYALTPIRSRATDGSELLKRWIAERAPWETTAVVLDPSYIPVTAGVTADYTDGIWTFTASQDEVFVNGTTFDVYGAAADLLDQWAVTGSNVTSGGAVVEWETDGQRVKRAPSTAEERRSLASSYRAMSIPLTSRLSRSDMRGEAWL